MTFLVGLLFGLGLGILVSLVSVLWLVIHLFAETNIHPLQLLARWILSLLMPGLIHPKSDSRNQPVLKPPFGAPLPEAKPNAEAGMSTAITFGLGSTRGPFLSRGAGPSGSVRNGSQRGVGHLRNLATFVAATQRMKRIRTDPVRPMRQTFPTKECEWLNMLVAHYIPQVFGPLFLDKLQDYINRKIGSSPIPNIVKDLMVDNLSMGESTPRIESLEFVSREGRHSFIIDVEFYYEHGIQGGASGEIVIDLPAGCFVALPFNASIGIELIHAKIRMELPYNLAGGSIAVYLTEQPAFKLNVTNSIGYARTLNHIPIIHRILEDTITDILCEKLVHPNGIQITLPPSLADMMLPEKNPQGAGITVQKIPVSTNEDTASQSGTTSEIGSEIDADVDDVLLSRTESEQLSASSASIRKILSTPTTFKQN